MFIFNFFYGGGKVHSTIRPPTPLKFYGCFATLMKLVGVHAKSPNIIGGLKSSWPNPKGRDEGKEIQFQVISGLRTGQLAQDLNIAPVFPLFV